MNPQHENEDEYEQTRPIMRLHSLTSHDSELIHLTLHNSPTSRWIIKITRSHIYVYLCILFGHKISEHVGNTTGLLEVAVLSDNRQITTVNDHLQLAVADNIQSLLLLFSPLCTILNRQYYFNYFYLPICNTTESEDDCVA